MLTQERLKQLLNYVPITGIFTWRVRNGTRGAVGKIAGSVIHAKKYKALRIKIDGKPYLSHRLAWLFMTGEWPLTDLDHKNMNTLDNRFKNLREATKKQNGANRSVLSNNVSGYKGVSFYKRTKKWVAYIGNNNKKIHLGYFNTPEEAHAAYVTAANKYFGEFARNE